MNTHYFFSVKLTFIAGACTVAEEAPVSVDALPPLTRRAREVTLVHVGLTQLARPLCKRKVVGKKVLATKSGQILRIFPCLTPISPGQVLFGFVRVNGNQRNIKEPLIILINVTFTSTMYILFVAGRPGSYPDL